MTYGTTEIISTTDHNNSGIILDYGNCNLSYEQMAIEMREKAAERLGEFNSMWERIQLDLQWPVHADAEGRLDGYSGHRNVTFEDRMGRCALGFHLVTFDGDDYRAITAYRRKIYADNRRRVNYTSDELSLRAQDIINDPKDPAVGHRIGVMRTWVEKYYSAEPYL
ncbi:MAG: hypothetical protein H6797_03250 [Candidatus Nomurabacteria bacterium]|nr:MAG: hypothetical protein H6797_03250 [Candidatus Nomurabacteria bacterium]